MAAIITFLAFSIDWFLGDPQSWPHPVRFIGQLITLVEKVLRSVLNHINITRPVILILSGLVLTLVVTAVTGLVTWLVLFLSNLISPVLWFIACLYLVFSAFCLRDLLKHTARVEQALSDGDLTTARQALSMIVGRDTTLLDNEAIHRAVIETLAENFSDGLVAPFFYLALGGPILAWIYKAINTLDSMVGYKNNHYIHLGRVSARIDDVANFIPARLSALILIVSSAILRYNYKNAFRLWRKEGRFHSSPNSGQTEATMAGALGIFLGGPSYYDGQLVEKPVIGSTGRTSTLAEVKAAEVIVTVGSVITLLLVLVTELLTLGSDYGLWLISL